jgi:nitrite reductase/ring-hydroxylating ferredoxin subunit
LEKPEDWRRVAAFSDIPNGGFKCIDIDEVNLLICRVHGDVYAAINNCPHQGLRMDHAAMFEHEIVCPHHNACFDIRTGKRLSGPAIYPLGGYPCRVVAGEVEVDLANPDTSMDRYMRAFDAALRAGRLASGSPRYVFQHPARHGSCGKIGIIVLIKPPCPWRGLSII